MTIGKKGRTHVLCQCRLSNRQSNGDGLVGFLLKCFVQSSAFRFVYSERQRLEQGQEGGQEVMSVVRGQRQSQRARSTTRRAKPKCKKCNTEGRARSDEGQC
jgi:hypothetical protein